MKRLIQVGAVALSFLSFTGCIATKVTEPSEGKMRQVSVTTNVVGAKVSKVKPSISREGGVVAVEISLLGKFTLEEKKFFVSTLERDDYLAAGFFPGVMSCRGEYRECLQNGASAFLCNLAFGCLPTVYGLLVEPFVPHYPEQTDSIIGRKAFLKSALIGFSRYFRIPAGEKASAGAYCPGPGLDFFKKAFEKLGPLPIIAEDLGYITPCVRGLVAACGFPGMDIIQFADGEPLYGYTPRPEKITYTGTHDNQTLLGFCKDRYPEVDPDEAAEKLMRSVITCPAPVAILPLQDVLGLDDEARMNVPGVAEGNWSWQADDADVAKALEFAQSLSELHRESHA